MLELWVRCRMMTGNESGAVHDDAWSGTVLGQLEVEVEEKETVSALKARMLQAARDAGIISDDDER